MKRMIDGVPEQNLYIDAFTVAVIFHVDGFCKVSSSKCLLISVMNKKSSKICFIIDSQA